MPPPSPLHIATQSVQRLLKEETSYRKELTQQGERVKKLGDEVAAGGSSEDGNAEFMLRQEKLAMAETEAVFAPLKKRIDEAVVKLEAQIAESEEGGKAPTEELAKGKEVLGLARDAKKQVTEAAKAKGEVSKNGAS